MRKLIHAICLLYLFCFPSYTQTNLRTLDTRSVGLGGNYVTHSVLFNPACIGLSTSQTVDFNYFNKFQLKELTSASLSYTNPHFILPTAVHISSFGYNKYRQTMFRIAFSKALAKKWEVGIGIQYAFLQTELFEEEATRLSTDVGILFLPDENLLIGMSITDMPSARIGNKSLDIKDFNSYSFQTGFQWNFINNLLIVLSTTYTNDFDLRFNMGLEYTSYNNFTIRTGLQTNPIVPSLGTGFKIDSFEVDVAVNYHQILGVCFGIGLSYLF